VGGRPFEGGVALLVHRRRTHVRCQPTTVSGRTMTIAVRQFVQIRREAIQNSRSRACKRGRRCARFIAISCCPERQVLQDQFSMSAESQRQGTTDEDRQLEHVPILAGAGARINSDEFWRTSGRFCVGQSSLLLTRVA
jgi:hypothetical protein